MIGMIRQSSSGRSKALKAHLLCCRLYGRPRLISKKPREVIANYVKALTKAAPPRVVALSSVGANRTSGLGMITALSLLEQGFRDLISPIAFVRAGGFFENFLYGLQVAQSGTLPVYYNPTNRKSTMVATNDIGAEVATLLTGPAWPDIASSNSVRWSARMKSRPN